MTHCQLRFLVGFTVGVAGGGVSFVDVGHRLLTGGPQRLGHRFG